VLRAAHDNGVEYVVSDTSRPGYDSPTPNVGVVNAHQPSILMIPRRPTNLFVDVSTPDEWVEAYNAVHAAELDHRLTYDEILDRESDVLVGYLLRGEINPLMFHQANLRAYDGQRSVLSDLLDRTLEKYDRLVDLPIASPSLDEIGRSMRQRMQYNAAAVSAQLGPGPSLTIRARGAAIVPVTGLGAGGSEPSGRRPVSYVELDAGESVTLALESPARSADPAHSETP
jgi:hypothetical protein